MNKRSSNIQGKTFAPSPALMIKVLGTLESVPISPPAHTPASNNARETHVQGLDFGPAQPAWPET